MNKNLDKMINKMDSETQRLVNRIIKYNRSKLKLEEKFSKDGFTLVDSKDKIIIVITKKKIIIETTFKINDMSIQNISKKIKFSNNRIEFPISKMITEDMIDCIMSNIKE